MLNQSKEEHDLVITSTTRIEKIVEQFEKVAFRPASFMDVVKAISVISQIFNDLESDLKVERYKNKVLEIENKILKEKAPTDGNQ